mmetsp:Transcript_57490/g.151320  ORF Transcript_57490/g.151320 Transcript_57490/m.151320 type:complete len:167 (-) Transcript_57490:30-530(-)
MAFCFVWFLGLVQGFWSDSSCMQPGDLLYGITASEKEELGWVCCDNTILAEPAWFYHKAEGRTFQAELLRLQPGGNLTFYDSSCGLPLYTAPVGRSVAEFLQESEAHKWPSFREAEIVHENIVMDGSEIISRCGTHLGHDLPDSRGTRHCVNLVCVAGRGLNASGV